MPELPEVESVIRTLRDARPSLIGRRVEQVEVVWDGIVSGCSPDLFRTHLSGAIFASVARLGKYMIFAMDCNGDGGNSRRYLIMHLRMTGRLFLVPAAEALVRHTRLALLLDQGAALRFDDPRKFGRVWLVDDPAEVIGSLGPDALCVGFDQFSRRLVARNCRLKPLLLDQSFVAGIGNIYADESLFRAGLHPLSNSRDLSADDLHRLHCAVHSVLMEAVEAKGANIDGVFKAGSFRVAVYGRQGHPCPVCGTAIEKSRVAQRGTHYCPQCQVRR
jgi:formamidopyrimidine-DNA glycosylase